MVAGRSRVDAMPFRAGEHRLHWKDGKLSLRFTHTLRTPGSDGGIDSRESDQTAYTTLAAAVRAWNGSTAAAVSVDVGWTDATRISTEGQNVVSFTDTAPFDDGTCDKQTAAACTVLVFALDTTRASGCRHLDSWVRSTWAWSCCMRLATPSD